MRSIRKPEEFAEKKIKIVFHISNLWNIADVAFQQGGKGHGETNGLSLYLKHSMAWACFDVVAVRLFFSLAHEIILWH